MSASIDRTAADTGQHIFWRRGKGDADEPTYETRYFPAYRHASECAAELTADGSKWMYGGTIKTSERQMVT